MTGAGVGKCSRLIAFGAASGNPSPNIVSTFDNVPFPAVLCISPDLQSKAAVLTGGLNICSLLPSFSFKSVSTN